MYIIRLQWSSVVTCSLKERNAFLSNPQLNNYEKSMAGTNM